MNDEMSAFKRRIKEAHAAAQRRTIVVNIVDPSGDLSIRKREELRPPEPPEKQPEGDEPRSELGPFLAPGTHPFVLIDLSACLSTEAIPEDAVEQLLAQIEGSKEQRDDPLRAHTEDLRMALSPWSSSSRHELRREMQQRDRPTPATVLAIQGLDDHPDSWTAPIAGVTRWLADCLQAPITFLITEKRQYQCHLRIRRPLPGRGEFQSQIEGKLKRLSVAALDDAPKDSSQQADGIPTQGGQSAQGDKRRTRQPSLPWILVGLLSNLFWPAFFRGNRERLERLGRPETPSIEDLAGLITAATYPSFRLRDQALLALFPNDRMPPLGNHGPIPPDAPQSSPGGKPAQPTADTREDDIAQAAAEAEALLPTMFLKLLDIAFPDLMHATQTEPDGYHCLYRLQLQLAPTGSRSEILVSRGGGVWDAFSQDARLKSFFSYAMRNVDETGRPLVSPFVSATAIKRHALGLDADSNDSWQRSLISLRDTLEEIASSYFAPRAEREKTIAHLVGERDKALCELLEIAKPRQPAHTNGESEGNSGSRDQEILEAARTLASTTRELESATSTQQAPKLNFSGVREAIKTAREALTSNRQSLLASSEAGDLIEDALRRLALLETNGASDGSHTADEWRKALDLCIADLRLGREHTEGALGLDAEIGIARALTLLGDFDGATRAIEAAGTWAGRDSLSRAAVQLGIAFLAEVRGNLVGAESTCREMMRLADEVGARELTARAGYGVLRCRIAQTEKSDWQQLMRAQAFLSIQAARSPFVPAVVRGTEPRIFVSYRSEARSFVRRLHEQSTRLRVWADFDAIDEAHTEFRPAMQLGLSLSEAVLIVFSPGYFESRWCSYELTTALAQQRTNGQKVCWVCVDLGNREPGDPKSHVLKLARRYPLDSDQAFFSMQLEAALSRPPLLENVITSEATRDGNENTVVEKILKALEKELRIGAATNASNKERDPRPAGGTEHGASPQGGSEGAS